MQKLSLLSRECEIAPLRTLDDFLLEAARFQMPNIKDLEKWGNRVMNNLLYYQTNYFIVYIFIFMLVSFLSPLKMILGITALAAVFGLFYLITNEQPAAAQFKNEHPILRILLIVLVCSIVIYMLDAVALTLYGFLVPNSVTFIHASLRLRNIKNKVVNKIDSITARKTPMAVLLNSLGFECTM